MSDTAVDHVLRCEDIVIATRLFQIPSHGATRAQLEHHGFFLLVAESDELGSQDGRLPPLGRIGAI